MTKRYQVQFIIGATITGGGPFDVNALCTEVLNTLAVPPQVEITSISTSFVPKQESPFDQFGQTNVPGDPAPAADEPDSKVAGSIPQSDR